MSEQDSNSEEMLAQYRAETAIEKQEAEQTNVGNSNSSQQQQQQQSEVKKGREGWIQSGEGFWKFQNYDGLASEYKEFLPRKTTEKGQGIVHVDPFDGKTYKYGVNFFPNGGSSVWSKEWDTTKSTSSSYSGKKYYYKTIDVLETTRNEAKAFLATNESMSDKRIKYVGFSTVKNVTQSPDGSKTVGDKILHVLLVEQRVEFG